MVLINLHRNLHEKSSFLSEIMFIRINPYLCHLLTRYQSTIFPNHKSCVRKKGVPVGTLLFCGIFRSAEPHGIRSRFPPHGRRRSERRDVPDILLPTRLRQFIPDCGQCFGSTPPRPANRPAARGTLPADRRPRKTEEISAWKSPRFHNRILRLY